MSELIIVTFVALFTFVNAVMYVRSKILNKRLKERMHKMNYGPTIDTVKDSNKKLLDTNLYLTKANTKLIRELRDSEELVGILKEAVDARNNQLRDMDRLIAENKRLTAQLNVRQTIISSIDDKLIKKPMEK